MVDLRICSIRKLFRIDDLSGYSKVKLNKKRIKEIIDKKKYGFSSRFIANKFEVSVRRVQQLVKTYKETKKY
ncbi:hypothetical protein J4216_06700 [Candidatus Woesearchaeota archaeon]|nr:hypothetical protein [Candidatus Woesearchaeota archaeon]